MWCPVHHREGCACQYAVKPGWPDPPESITLAGVRSPGLAKVSAKKRASAPKLLAISFAGLVLACGPRPSTCSERDAELLTHEAVCLAQVKTKCAGIPADEPCPFEEDCKKFTRERCK